MLIPKLQTGQIISVRSWWWDDERIIKCEVIEDGGPDYPFQGVRIRVRPISSRGHILHTRYITSDRVISI
jgi:hypothetical protein